MNRFKDCKTLGHLFNVFNGEEGFDYEDLTPEELNRLADVFEANLPDKISMPDRPLTKAGYTLIWDVTIDTVEDFINKAEDSIKNDAIKNKEEKNMDNNKFKNILEEEAKRMSKAMEGVKVKTGQTVEEYFSEVDDSLNVVKGAFGNALKILDEFTGFSVLKKDLLDIYHAGERGTGKKDLYRMAEKCREKINKEIESIDELTELELMDGDEAKKMKDVLEELKGSNIFKRFVTILVFFARRIIRRIKKWFNAKGQEKTVFGTICKSVSDFAKVAKAGLKVVYDTAKFAASFIVAGVMVIAAPIIKAIMSLVEKIKGWAENRFKKTEDFEEEFEDDFFEEEFAE